LLLRTKSFEKRTKSAYKEKADTLSQSVSGEFTSWWFFLVENQS